MPATDRLRCVPEAGCDLRPDPVGSGPFDPGRATLGARPAPTKPVIHRHLWITLLIVWNTPPGWVHSLLVEPVDSQK